ncbi:hypothetical protein EYC80_006561 [Monilinia laxa]|uniref:Uncharacterized protein n=1 Tax=Monilinia laxa TaxID=61186 RepID=A0A5N6JU58_MONLA|nr:hypothetical protein EYC80_006561 [Monilinia laxa]
MYVNDIGTYQSKGQDKETWRDQLGGDTVIVIAIVIVIEESFQHKLDTYCHNHKPIHISNLCIPELIPIASLPRASFILFLSPQSHHAPFIFNSIVHHIHIHSIHIQRIHHHEGWSRYPWQELASIEMRLVYGLL